MSENDKDDRFNMRAFLRAKRSCQLIVRLKAIKDKDDISFYLSFSIFLRILDFCYQSSNFWPLNFRWYYQQYNLLISTSNLIVFVLKSILCF